MTKTLLNNRYQVIQVLGVGGFGETFLAEDTHLPSRRRCVIKQLKPISDDPKTYQMIQKRFEREAAILEYLGEGSDQIPKLYAYFSESGQFYLVQEWIQGQTLTNVIQSQGNLGETIVREILLSLLSILDYVHSKGIIHRDIKPDNIILRTPDNKPVLIDFGAVKETIRTVANSSGNPTQSLVIGTPGYMPIEQAIGRPVYATDIYSLGLSVIYLLTGKYPQELETHPQTGQILWQQYVPHISPQLVMVLSQAIEPRTSDRYSTASKMLYALQPVNNATINYTPLATIPPTKANPIPSKTLVIPPVSNSGIWQNPTIIFGSLLVGSLIGAIIISDFIRPEVTTPIASTSNPDTVPTILPTPAITADPSPVAIAPTPATQQRINSYPLPNTNNPEELTSLTLQKPVIENTPSPPVLSTPQPEVEPTQEVVLPDTQKQQPQPQPKVPDSLITSNPSLTVPAFPTGTSRSSVEATLGKPRKDLRGLWGNTRAVTYKFVPNQIDLGYLFDRQSGKLRQTEVSFAASVDLQVMQTTLNQLLEGKATAEIQEGLKKIQKGQKDNFQFSQGAVKGQIVRQNCNFIYISIWDSDLHDFVSPAAAKQC
ncbi:protein kinase [Anabaena sp. UHCC 0253]|uniref:protein kinase domain-containing protein n=1 Tax=Anabaena sp. UHCC 0253 TaxID=2590019 RepID=UPI001447FDD1|nr:protein kinase [Anabaena sp. UHCC 0253]MTJ53604.1 protein kinase [Anabaena sp. UHCC 0253]